MNKIKKLLAFIVVLAMCIALIPAYYAKADEQASTSIISDADIVTVTVILLPTVPLAELIDIEACSSALA